MNRLAQVTLLVIVWSCAAFATSIGFTETITATGTIGSTSFSDANMTIRGFGSEARVVHLGGNLYSLDLSYVTITIQGVGTFRITTPTRFFANGVVVGFSHAGANGDDLIDGPGISQVWDMKTSLGPITGGGEISDWDQSVVMSSGGRIVLNDDGFPMTFSATVGAQAPEPATICLFVTGLGGIGTKFLLRRRRK